MGVTVLPTEARGELLGLAIMTCAEGYVVRGTLN